MTLFRSLLSREVIAALVMLAVLAARWLFQKVPKRMTILLWAVVCFRLLSPVSVESPVSLVPRQAASLSSAVQRLPASGELEDLVLGPAAAAEPAQFAVQPSVTPRQVRTLVFALAAFLWAAGALALLGFQLMRLVRLKKRLRGAEEAEPGIYISNRIAGAFVLGLVRPCIYLPAGLSAQERQYVLLHEKTHIRRLDHVWKLLAYLCLCIHWFDPLVWLCFGLFCRDVELACDEAASAALDRDARCDYAQTLLNLAGKSPVSPLPSFSEPEPEKRIRRILSWKRPGRMLCALALVLVLLLGAGLLFNPASKDGIFAQRYQADALLYSAPQFDFTYTGGPYPAYALSENYMLYEKQPGGSFNECGGLQKVSLSSKQLFALFDVNWMEADGDWQPPGGDLLEPSVRAQLARVKSGWLCKRSTEPQAPFYLVMQSGKQLLLTVGYGWDTDTALVRWLFSLTPDPTLFTTQELAALIRRSNSLTDQQSIQIYSVYEPESIPGLLFAAYDGDDNGVAVLSYDAAIPGYYIRMLTSSLRQDFLYSETSTWYDLGKSFSIITSHHENAAEVRAVWNGVELTAPITACPAMVILEWPDVFPLNPDSSPDIRFYNAAGEELLRE